MNQSFQRARSPEHKEQRRQAILAAAGRVLEKEGLQGTSLQAIAKETGVVKSGLYRYFESREDILLQLLSFDLNDALGELALRVKGPCPTPQLAAIVAQGLIDRPRLCLLVSQMTSILDQNVTGDNLRMIKRGNFEASHEVTKILRIGAPHLGYEACRDAVMMLFALVAGLWPMTHPVGHVAEILNEPEFKAQKKEFPEAIHGAALAMFLGVERLSQEQIAPVNDPVL